MDNELPLGKRVDTNNKTEESQKKEVPCEGFISFDDFRIPDVPKFKSKSPGVTNNTNNSNNLSKSKDCFELDNSFGFGNSPHDIFKDPGFLTGRPSLLFDDGRESLGILPQFKLPWGSKANYQLESADSFLNTTPRQFDPFSNSGRPSLLYDRRESLGILPSCKINFAAYDTIDELECWLPSSKSNNESESNKEVTDVGEDQKSTENALVKFEKDCEAIESGKFKNPEDTADENYSVYAEANFLASKIADNSILDISGEGGSFLDNTPQPDLIEEGDSLNQSEKKVDTQSVFKKIDLMLPPNTPDAACSGKNLPDTRNAINDRPSLVKHLSDLVTQFEDKQLQQILQSCIKQIEDLDDNSNIAQQNLSSVDEEDSGHSSTENEKELRQCNAALDLSYKAHNSENARALDLSFAKDTMPHRLSITFSHQNEPGLPDKQPSNKLKQQTLHMRQLWPSANNKVGESSDGSIPTNDSKTSSTGSMRAKLKPKKTEQDLKRGPLKAVVPLASLNTSLTLEATKPRTPPNKFAPIARSTPDESGIDRRKQSLLGTPVSRPGKITRITPRPKLNRSKSMGIPNAPEKSLVRGKSASDLKQLPTAQKLTLTRSYSVGGKENLSTQQSLKQGVTTSRMKLPQKVLSRKSLN